MIQISDKQKSNVVLVLQILLGILFTFSGFAKVIDPLGGWYKVDDYLTAFGWDFLKVLGFVGSVALSIFEFALGICLLFGTRSKLVALGVLLMMAFMTPLTLYIAIFNPVTDCGCFGEALKISNWATFWKNIVFSSMAILLYVWAEYSTRDNSWKRFITIVTYTTLFLIGVTIYCYKNLPIIDFRPYAIGVNIPKSMEIPEGAPSDKFETFFTYEKDGVKKEVKFESDEYKTVSKDSTWTCTDSRSELVEKGYEPPIHDFTMEDPEDGDLTEDVMANEGYTFIAISSKVEKADLELAKKHNDVFEFAQANEIPFYMLTATGLGTDELAAYKEITGAEYRVLNADEITLKTVVRSNPGLVLIKNGNVVNKWAVKNIPDFQKLLDEANGDLSKVKEMQMDVPNNYLTAFLFFLLFFVGLVAVIKAVDKIVK